MLIKEVPMVVTQANVTKREVLCKACGGRMKQAIVPKHSRRFGAVLIVSGAGCSLFWIGLVLGIPLSVMGVYMVAAKKQVWICGECQSTIDRHVEESIYPLRF